MQTRSIIKFCVTFLLLGVSFTLSVRAQGSLGIVNEKLSIRALQTIHAAEMTFSATTGAGNFGNIQQLANDSLIDAVLGTGEKYGYSFSITTVPWSPGHSAVFQVSAVPQRYGKSGKRSFYIDEMGVIRGADRGGAPASADDPIVPILCGESGAISATRSLNSAEATYFATMGANINFGTLTQLAAVNLVDGYLATGEKCGYRFTVIAIAANVATNTPAVYRVNAEPLRYPTSGIRSFYTDETGILRGADHGGAPANVNDPPIEN